MLKFLCLFFLCFASCSRSPLHIQTTYLSKHDLASFIINTPDPALYDPPIGQKLILTWAIPKQYQGHEDLSILLKIRFHNHESLEKTIKVGSSHGVYVYCLLNDDYCDKKGILTYKAELYQNSCLITQWLHQLWVDPITFKTESAETEDDQEILAE